MRVLAFAVAAVAAVASARATATLTAPTLDLDFAGFKRKFGKRYASPEEHGQRQAVFYANVAELRAMGDPTLGITEFTDMTDEEFAARWLGKVADARPPSAPRFYDGTSCPACKRFPELRNVTAAADAFDWTDHGAVTNVKTQNCGDCYAFSAAADIEGSYFLAGNALTPVNISQSTFASFERAAECISRRYGPDSHSCAFPLHFHDRSMSVEQIDDCCFEDMSILDCAGCAGGEPHEVFTWLQTKVAGMCSDAAYPYTVPKRQPHPSACQRGLITKADVTARVTGWYFVSQGAASESNITAALPKIGPVSIGMDALHAKMKQYTGGIAQPVCAKGSVLNHALLLVGYGTENGVDYWKVKNSWGTGWGEDGYYRVVRGKNACGIAEDVTHSEVAR